MFDLLPLALNGAFEIRPRVLADRRGLFCKLFHEPAFRDRGLEIGFTEEYYSVSQARVLRGLHFQTPPHDHVKLVYCLSGAALDVLVDMRRHSPSFGRHTMVELNEEMRNGVYVPKGFAHGFYVRQGPATLLYKTSTVHAPDSDTGIRWDSAGIAWPEPAPILSERDRALPPLDQLASPFP